MQSAFNGYSNLKYLDLSKFDTSKITTIHTLFKDCSSLIYLNLISFKLSSLKNKDDVFGGISSYVKFCINDEHLNLLPKNTLSKLFRYLFSRKSQNRFE